MPGAPLRRKFVTRVRSVAPASVGAKHPPGSPGLSKTVFCPATGGIVVHTAAEDRVTMCVSDDKELALPPSCVSQYGVKPIVRLSSSKQLPALVRDRMPRFRQEVSEKAFSKL
jgi:hypothetical protein